MPAGGTQQAKRQAVVDRVLGRLRLKALVPTTYERWLLGQYVSGHLSLFQLVEALQARDAMHSQVVRTGRSLIHALWYED